MTTKIIMKSRDNLTTTDTEGGSFKESFPNDIIEAKAFVSGFELIHKHDRHIREIAAKVTNVTHEGKSVTVDYLFLMKDDSESTNNHATGQLGVVILAEVKA